MKVVAFGLQGIVTEALTVRLYSVLYGIVSWQLVLPVHTMGTDGTTLTAYVAYTCWVHSTVTVTLLAKYPSEIMPSIGV